MGHIQSYKPFGTKLYVSFVYVDNIDLVSNKLCLKVKLMLN